MTTIRLVALVLVGLQLLAGCGKVIESGPEATGGAAGDAGTAGRGAELAGHAGDHGDGGGRGGELGAGGATGGSAGTPAVGGAGGAGGPCEGICTSPQKFTAVAFNSGSLGTDASCWETSAAISGVACGNFSGSRALVVNGQPITCNGSAAAAPMSIAGGYCFQITAGDSSSAYFATF
jgi:hypothetical protein